MRPCLPRPEHGTALVVALALLVILFLITSLFLWTSEGERNIATNHRDALQALYIAEAGAQRALKELSDDTDLSNYPKTMPRESLGRGFYEAVIEQDPAGSPGDMLVKATGWVPVLPGDPPDIGQDVLSGMFAERMIKVAVRIGGFKYALLSDTDIREYGHSELGWTWEKGASGTVTGNVHANDKVDLDYGPGGKLSVQSGQVTENNPNIPVPVVNMECFDPTAPGFDCGLFSPLVCVSEPSDYVFQDQGGADPDYSNTLFYVKGRALIDMRPGNVTFSNCILVAEGLRCKTTAIVTAGTNSIPVDDTSDFPGSGSATIGSDIFTYTLTTPASFEGVTGVNMDQPSETEISGVKRGTTASPVAAGADVVVMPYNSETVSFRTRGLAYLEGFPFTYTMREALPAGNPTEVYLRGCRGIDTAHAQGVEVYQPRDAIVIGRQASGLELVSQQYTSSGRNLELFIRNAGENTIVADSLSAQWTVTGLNEQMKQVDMAASRRWKGTVGPGVVVPFDSAVTMYPGGSPVDVKLYFSADMRPGKVTSVTFYDGAIQYTIDLTGTPPTLYNFSFTAPDNYPALVTKAGNIWEEDSTGNSMREIQSVSNTVGALVYSERGFVKFDYLTLNGVMAASAIILVQDGNSSPPHGFSIRRPNSFPDPPRPSCAFRGGLVITDWRQVDKF